MRVFARVQPNSRVVKVEEIKTSLGNAKQFFIRVREKPINGMANKAVLRALAEHFKIPAYKIKLISGSSHKEKVFEVETDL